MQVAKTFDEIVHEARESEDAGELERAGKLYERAMKLEPHNELPYNRAMVVYRKLRQYEDELRIINRGITQFETFYQKRSQKILGKDKKAVQLSNALAKSLGLKDKKGKDQFHPQPIERWLKRKEVVEKKLGKT